MKVDCTWIFPPCWVEILNGVREGLTWRLHINLVVFLVLVMLFTVLP